MAGTKYGQYFINRSGASWSSNPAVIHVMAFESCRGYNMPRSKKFLDNLQGEGPADTDDAYAAWSGRSGNCSNGLFVAAGWQTVFGETQRTDYPCYFLFLPPFLFRAGPFLALPPER